MRYRVTAALRRVSAVAAIGVCLVAGPAPANTFLEEFPEHAEAQGPEREFLDALVYRHGEVALPDERVVLDVPDAFYFLDQKDARRVLEEAWGNPPTEYTLGMLFPARMTPLDARSWGVEITFDDIGYVSDDEADEIDYDALLQQMQDDVETENAEREKAGFQRIALIGWAATPRYDATTRKLHWAKELKFGDNETNTLNYNIRALGRKGVLVMNFIADIDSLPEIQDAIEPVLAMSRFVEGERYQDFDPDLDTVAAVGIGGLIAGKVLTKTGLLVVALALLKKFWFVLLAPLFFIRRWFSRARD